MNILTRKTNRILLNNNSKSAFKPRLQYFFYALIISIGISGCAFDSHQIKTYRISKILKKSTINQDHFTGFALYDQGKKKMICQENADKYFTPASNIKLFTFYTALQMLGDSICHPELLSS